VRVATEMMDPADIYVMVAGRMWLLRAQTERGSKEIGVPVRQSIQRTALEAAKLCETARTAGLRVSGDPAMSLA
jgi:hypothetical protein